MTVWSYWLWGFSLPCFISCWNTFSELLRFIFEFNLAAASLQVARTCLLWSLSSESYFFSWDSVSDFLRFSITVFDLQIAFGWSSWPFWPCSSEWDFSALLSMILLSYCFWGFSLPCYTPGGNSSFEFSSSSVWFYLDVNDSHLAAKWTFLDAFAESPVGF